MEDSKETVMQTEEVVDTTTEVNEAQNPNLDALKKRASELELNYKQVSQLANNTVELIKELDDRILKQKEALNVFNARLLQIEDEYSKITSQLK